MAITTSGRGVWDRLTPTGGALLLPCLFATDLHGDPGRYRSLFGIIRQERPKGVFLGGDLLPGAANLPRSTGTIRRDFVTDFLMVECRNLLEFLGEDYPQLMLILGNDDPRFQEAAILNAAATGVWHYLHDRMIRLGEFDLYGYSYIPPSPFLLKDWERYDVSRYVDPGCVSPEEGHRSIPVSFEEMRYTTIRGDLERLAGTGDMERAIFLFHAPPYRTHLDRAALDGMLVEHVPMDLHVGSIAIRRFIELRQPKITLHGHVHESARLTGRWCDQIGRTYMLSAAHDGPELALVRFDADHPENATRELIAG